MRPQWYMRLLCFAVLLFGLLATSCLTRPTAYTPEDGECIAVEFLGEPTTVEFGKKRFQVALLTSRSQRINGLLHACPLLADSGALFVMPHEKRWAFHMKGMNQDLDIAFFSSDGKLVGYRQAKIGESNIQPDARAKYVVEVATGTFPKDGPTEGRVLIPLSAKASVSPEIHERPCDAVRAAKWRCPLPLEENGPQMTLTNSYVGRNSDRVTCAARVAKCVYESQSFAARVREMKFQDGGYKGLGKSHGKLDGEAVYASIVKWSAASADAKIRPWSGPSAWFFRTFKGTTAVTYLETGPIKLNVRYVRYASVDRLVATIVHEWLHVLGFRDPSATGDAQSVVYGTEASVKELALQVLAETE